MTDMDKTSEWYLVWKLINGLEIYYLPALVCLGSLGNCLSVYVVFATKMRRSSSSFYLAALAISDTGFLISLLFAWLGVVNVNIYNKSGFCPFFVYLTNVCSFLSAWFVVAFTVERFVAVCYPLRRQWMCTVSRAKIILASVTVVGLVLCSPVLLYSGPRAHGNSTKESCHVVEGWEDQASALNLVDTIVTFAVPFSLIVVLNFSIIRTVWRIQTVRNSLKARVTSRDLPSMTHQTRVTKMLIVVSSVFFCFNLPAYVMRVHAFLQAENDVTEAAYVAQRACNLLFYTNYGISFGLYCASGQNFRSAVYQLLCRRDGRQQTETIKRTSTNQTHQVTLGSEMVRTCGSTIGDHTILINKPWKNSYRMKTLSKNRALNPDRVTEASKVRL